MKNDYPTKNTLLIGYGRFGKILYEKLRALSNVVAICKTKTDDYRPFLTRDDINLVIIATPTITHVVIAKDALMAHKNVFVEKPLSADPKEVREISALAKQQNKKIYIDEVFLWREEYRRLREHANAETIASLIFSFQKYGTFDDTIFNAHAYHDFYILADLLGEREINNLEILSTNDPLEKGRIDQLSFRFSYGGIPVEGHYDRASRKRYKEITLELKIGKTITWRNNMIIENEMADVFPPHDALGNMIQAVVEDRVDYLKNNALALQASTILSEINNVLSK